MCVAKSYETQTNSVGVQSITVNWYNPLFWKANKWNANRRAFKEELSFSYTDNTLTEL